MHFSSLHNLFRDYSLFLFSLQESWHFRDFSGGPMVKISCFCCRRHEKTPGQGTEISHAMWCSQTIKFRKKKEPWHFVINMIFRVRQILFHVM